MPTSEQLGDVIQLLKENRVQDAANALAVHQSAARVAEDAAAGRVPEPPPPRSPGPIMSDLLHEIVAHLGHTPRLQALIDELDEAEGPIK